MELTNIREIFRNKDKFADKEDYRRMGQKQS